jgi:hypothetical protein
MHLARPRQGADEVEESCAKIVVEIIIKKKKMPPHPHPAAGSARIIEVA